MADETPGDRLSKVAAAVRQGGLALIVAALLYGVHDVVTKQQAAHNEVIKACLQQTR